MCPLCRGIRFRTCAVCRQPQNSFRDFRDSDTKPQMYPNWAAWWKEGQRK